MAAVRLTNVVNHLRSLVIDDHVDHLSDGQLLQRFAGARDEIAFEALVRRHGPLVLSVGRRLLGTGPDLDDVFQATFLVLARKAGSIRKQSSVASWLYGVAFRLSRHQQTQRARRLHHERPGGDLERFAEAKPMRTDAATHASLRELGAMLDEELQRLPVKYREALMLCHLEGQSAAEAAAQLGWPLGTLKSRLLRGRELIRARLVQRGVALSAAGLAIVLADQAASAALPAKLFRAALRGGVAYAAKPLASATVSAQAAALAEGVLKTMTFTKIPLAILALVLTGLLGVAVSFLAAQAPAAAPRPLDPLPPAPAAGQPPPLAKDLHGDPLPPGAVARLGTVRWRHGAPVHFLALLPDGKRAVSAANDRFVRVWDFATGKELHRFGPGPKAQPAAWGLMAFQGRLKEATAAVSTDGKLLATHFDQSGVELWDIASGKKLGTIPLGKDFEAGALAFAPDGKLLAIAGTNGIVRLWDVAAGKVVRALGKEPKEAVPFLVARLSLAVFAPDGKTFVSVLSEVENMMVSHQLTFWDPDTGQELRSVLARSRFGINSPAFSPDGTLFAYATLEGEICLLNAATGKMLHTWKLADRRDSPALAFAANGARLYSKTAADGFLREWDVKTGQELRRLGEAQPAAAVARLPGPTGCLALSADGKMLAVGGDGNSIRFVNVATGQESPAPGGHSHALLSLSYTPDGNSVATRGADHTLRQWNPATGKEVKKVALPQAASNFAVTPDGRYLAVEGERRAIHLTDNASGKKLATIPGPADSFPSFFFTPDSHTLLVRRLGETDAVLYDVPSAKERWRLPVGSDGLPKAAVLGLDHAVFFCSPDSKRLGVYAAAKSLAIYDVATGKVVQRIALADNVAVRSGAFSPDGRTLAIDQGDGVVQLIELATGRQRRSYGKKYTLPPAPMAPKLALAGLRSGPPGSATVAFSPDGRLLVYAGLDNALHVWDAATGQALARLEGHQGPIGTIAFAPDGRRLASASADTTALVWDVHGLSAKPGLAQRVLDADSLQARWNDLAADDGLAALEAVNALVSAPKQAVPFLKAQLQPAAVVDQALVRKLLEQLDSGEFKVRVKAQAELLKIGDQVLPYIEKELAGKLPLETRQRLEALQSKLSVTAMTADRLRLVRAIEALERIASTEAREVLHSLAEGAPGALATSQARAALERLK
jgi:RNA polymerase sigma factor (sigma-70 family)